MSHVFISYSKQNSVYVRSLAEKLRDEGFDVWIDDRRLTAGSDWWPSIVSAIWQCSAFIVVLSPESDASRWVQREITIADSRGKPIFPLLLAGDINTPNWAIFVRTQYTDLRSGELPPQRFYNELAQYAPRKNQRGENVSATASLPPVTDSMIAEINNPPPPDAFGQRARRLWPLLAVLLVAVVLIGGAALLLPGGGGGGGGPVPDPTATLDAALSATDYYRTASADFSGGRYARAITAYSYALQLGFEPAKWVYSNRGFAYGLLEQHDLAILDHRQASALDPRYANPYRGLGDSYFALGDNAAALENYRIYLTLTNNPPLYVLNRVEDLESEGAAGDG